MRGFSMVELIVVMLVMAVLSALAIPRLISTTPLKERGAQADLRGMLVHVRQLAMAQQRDVCVLVEPDQATAVYAPGGGACDLTPPAQLDGPDGLRPYRILAPTGVSFGGATTFRFNSRGQPVPDANQVVTVGSLSLTVQRETGLPISN
jgi:MSHA pilin protein MshC